MNASTFRDSRRGGDSRAAHDDLILNGGGLDEVTQGVEGGATRCGSSGLRRPHLLQNP